MADGSPNAPRAGRSRDSERSAVYAAENLVRRLVDRSSEFPTIEVAGSRITLPLERRFGSIESVQSYLDSVLRMPTVRRRWPERSAVPCTVRCRRGSGEAHYEFAGATIAVPTSMSSRRGTAWAMRELVVLHELAHHLTGAAETSHGTAFRGTLLDLIDLVIGPELRFLLLVTYADGGLRPS